MTDPTHLPPPDDPLDVAASAVVDGDATDEERSLVESSPDGQARLSAFRAVADAVGTPPPAQDQLAAESAIAAALGTTAVPATRARQQRQRKQTRWLVPVGAAAAAIVVALGIGSVVLVNDDDDGRNGTGATEQLSRAEGSTTVPAGFRAPEAATDSATNEAAVATSRAAGAVAGGGAGGTAAASGPSVIDGGELGPVNDPRVLAERAKAAIDGEAGSAPTAGAPASELAACDRAARQRSATLGALRYSATATYSGTPAVVLAYDAVDGGTPPRILEVLARADCRALTTTRF